MSNYVKSPFTFGNKEVMKVNEASREDWEKEHEGHEKDYFHHVKSDLRKFRIINCKRCNAIYVEEVKQGIVSPYGN